MPIYRAPFVSSALYNDPGDQATRTFHALGTEPGMDYTVLDLRPKTDLLPGFCFLATDEIQTDPRVVKLADVHTEVLAGAVRTGLGNALGITFAAPATATLGDLMGEIMLSQADGGHASASDPARWNPIGESWHDQTRTQVSKSVRFDGAIVFHTGLRANSHRTPIIEDGFGGASGDLQGNAPDVLNTPGNSWAGVTAQITYNGSGVVNAAASSDSARIDTGTLDMRVDTTYNYNSADNRAYVAARMNNVSFDAASTSDGYLLRWISGAPGNLQIFSRVNSSSTSIKETAPTLSISADIKYGLDIGGDQITSYLDDVLQYAAFTTTTINGTTEGGSFAGLVHALRNATAGDWKDFFVDNRAAAGGGPAAQSLSLMGMGI